MSSARIDPCRYLSVPLTHDILKPLPTANLNYVASQTVHNVRLVQHEPEIRSYNIEQYSYNLGASILHLPHVIFCFHPLQNFDACDLLSSLAGHFCSLGRCRQSPAKIPDKLVSLHTEICESLQKPDKSSGWGMGVFAKWRIRISMLCSIEWWRVVHGTY